MVNAKTSHNPFTHVNFHGVNLGELIKAGSCQFGFCDTPNGPSNNNQIDENHHNDNDGDISMILTKISNRDKVFLKIEVRYYLSQTHILHRRLKILALMENCIIRLKAHLSTCPPTAEHIFNC